MPIVFFFFFTDTATTAIYTLSLHDALPISLPLSRSAIQAAASGALIVASNTVSVRDLLEHGYSGLLFEPFDLDDATRLVRSEEHTSELQSRLHLVCRLLLEKKKKKKKTHRI